MAATDSEERTWALLCVIVIVIAAVRANSGERYRYPLCLRFIR